MSEALKNIKAAPQAGGKRWVIADNFLPSISLLGAWNEKQQHLEHFKRCVLKKRDRQLEGN